MGKRHDHRRQAEAMRDNHVKPREWLVKDSDGDEHRLTAHFAFDNGESGLLFRRYVDDNCTNKTEVVLHMAFGSWKFYKEVEA